MMARALMVQGTCSGAGKSLLVAGLCRIFSDEGLKAAPFKAQNMALNSSVTEDGREIGRAQALQAEAARLRPSADMNPVLLKATGDSSCQVIVNGRVHSNMSAGQYYAFAGEAWLAAAEAYERLSREHEIIVMEGAGSPAEINLAEVDIVNMRMARHAGAPVLLVGDIDRGGVFASFFGTVGLLDGDARRVKGFVVNKFRGDGDILLPGLRLIEHKTGVPVLGVVPYVRDIGLDEEDGISVARHVPRPGSGDTLRVVVLRLDYISNFTDFDPLRHEPDLELVYSLNRSDIEGADIVIIPGSKNTARDLVFIRQLGLEGAVRRAAARGAQVIGICGGYQMLGRKVSDPLGVESPPGDVEGMGLLDVETEMKAEKVVSLSEAEAASGFMGFSGVLRGYEIHMGETTGDSGLFRVRRLSDGNTVTDGSVKGSVWGTSLHGIFEDDSFRAAVLDAARKKKGMPFPEERFEYLKLKERNIDRWASVLREKLDMHFIRGLL